MHTIFGEFETHPNPARKPDLFFESEKLLVIHTTKVEENEKLAKYLDFGWGLKMTDLRIVAGCLRTVFENLENILENWRERRQIDR